MWTNFKKLKKVVYIHQYFTTREEGGGTRSYEFARFLLKRGHKVTILTGSKLNDSLASVKKINDEFEILRKNKPYHSFLPENAIPPLGFYTEKMEKFRNLLQVNGESEKTMSDLS